MSSFNMWKCDREEAEYKTATTETNKFFENIRDKGKIEFDGIKLSYRREQHNFAKDVMKAIKDNQILLVQAGVGIGKSMGYLIPIFKSINNVTKFERVVISTSNIALQQQLLTDINFISKLLGIELNVAIAKGINNYACIKRIEEIQNISQEEKTIIKKLRQEIERKHTIDKDELTQVSDEIWQKINNNNRGACSRCSYSRICLHRQIEKDLLKANIIVTNHGNFVRTIIDDNPAITSSDMYIFDEAHQLENSLIGINEVSIRLDNIRKSLNYFTNNNIISNEQDIELTRNLVLKIDNLFSSIRRKASYTFTNNNHEQREIKITDCDKIPFNIKELEECLKSIIKDLKLVLKKLHEIITKEREYQTKECKLAFTQLNNYLTLFKDMLKGNDSDNIYWVNYYKQNKINLGYVPKSNFSLSRSIFEKNIPIVCTSGTLLDANGSYNYFKQGLSLDKISSKERTIVDGRCYNSPYDYDNNSLFYYDKNMANPQNYEEYEKQLVEKITELIKITNGRTLILFTAKSTMESVYKKIKQKQFDFELMMQGEKSNPQLCKEFEKNVKSCLFATGAFWEGIDIKGKSLCNVIITRLPFSNVDAITENKASPYSKEEAFKVVYLNEMVKKIAQGTGRLIRSKKDKGIICCLDSRFSRYKELIKNCTPFTTFTSNINDVYEFSNKNITNRDGLRKIRKPKNK